MEIRASTYALVMITLAVLAAGFTVGGVLAKNHNRAHQLEYCAQRGMVAVPSVKAGGDAYACVRGEYAP